MVTGYVFMAELMATVDFRCEVHGGHVALGGIISFSETLEW